MAIATALISELLTMGGPRWAMRCPVLLMILILAACNTAGPHFRGLPATTVTVGGSTFDVRVRGELAEAIRTNMQYAPRFGPIRERAATAMAMVSGCAVKEVRGDQAQATGILDCGSGGPQNVPYRTGDIECEPERGTELELIGEVRVELRCQPA